jgi:hypothetical protein
LLLLFNLIMSKHFFVSKHEICLLISILSKSKQKNKNKIKIKIFNNKNKII